MLTKIFDFIFHRHYFELLSTYDITNENPNKIKGLLYIQKCSGCSKIKETRVEV